MSAHKNQSIETRSHHEPVILELIQYNGKDYAMKSNVSVDSLISEIKKDHVNWINVDGLHDRSIIQNLGKHFSLHPLFVSDVLSDHQPKAEEFDNYFFLTMKMLHSIKDKTIEYEQISFVLGNDFLLTFQDKAGDNFGAFRERLKVSSGRVRTRKSDYLMYRLVDIIVDNYYTVLDEVGHQIEAVEEDVYENPSVREFQKIQKIKKELIYLRKALSPLRDALSTLTKDETPFIEQSTKKFFGDVYDHVVHLIDALDTYKDLTLGLMDIHINTMNTRMNQIMKVLTVISTIFMPLTFIVGIYGMNFENMPELHSYWGYPLVMVSMLFIVFLMISYFKYKKWF